MSLLRVTKGRSKVSYMNTNTKAKTKTLTVLFSEFGELTTCEYFARCTNQTDMAVQLPFGVIPTCERCLEFAQS